MSRPSSWAWAAAILFGLALIGLPLAELAKPWLWAMVIALILSVFIGAKALSEKLGGWVLGLALAISCYGGFTHLVKERVSPGTVILLALFAFLVLALLAVAKLRPARRAESSRARPTIRSRIAVHKPTAEPVAPWASPPEGHRPEPDSDDLGLWGQGR